MSTKFNMREIESLVWKTAYAVNASQFNSCLEKIGKISDAAKKYLCSIPPIHWASYAIINKAMILLTFVVNLI